MRNHLRHFYVLNDDFPPHETNIYPTATASTATTTLIADHFPSGYLITCITCQVERERVCQAVGNHGNYIKMSFFSLSLVDPSSLFMVNPLSLRRLSLVKSGKSAARLLLTGKMTILSSKVLFIKTVFSVALLFAP